MSDSYLTELEQLYNTKPFSPPTDNMYFFDKEHNLHIFYNNTEKAKGKYFEYMMYEASDPTTPKYQQRIYR